MLCFIIVSSEFRHFYFKDQFNVKNVYFKPLSSGVGVLQFRKRGSIFLRNIDPCLANCFSSHPRRQMLIQSRYSNHVPILSCLQKGQVKQVSMKVKFSYLL